MIEDNALNYTKNDKIKKIIMQKHRWKLCLFYYQVIDPFFFV